MKLNELKSKLEELDVRPNVYSLHGGLYDDVFTIGYVDGKWEVYYSERGIKESLLTFNSEDEACDYFLDWILKSSRYVINRKPRPRRDSDTEK